MNSKKIAILGTGAIGSCIGANLTRAGYDVVLIDQWPAHVEAMKANGLRITRMQDLQVPVRAYHLCDMASLKPQFDIVFLVCKSYDSCWMAELIKPYLKADGVLVSTQNSLNDEWIAPIIGPERDIGCALELGAELFEPGLVKRNIDHDHARFVVGELDGRITPRVKEIAEMFNEVGRGEVTSNIWAAKWTKLALNTMGMSVAPAAGLGLPKLVMNHPKYLGLCVRLGRETLAVARALGYDLHPLLGLTTQDYAGSTDESLMKILLKVRRDSSDETLSTVLQDLLKGRRSEVPDYLNGLVVKKGRQLGIPTPNNEILASLFRQLESGELKMGLSNLELLEREMNKVAVQ